MAGQPAPHRCPAVLGTPQTLPSRSCLTRPHSGRPQDPQLLLKERRTQMRADESAVVTAGSLPRAAR